MNFIPLTPEQLLSAQPSILSPHDMRSVEEWTMNAGKVVEWKLKANDIKKIPNSINKYLIITKSEWEIPCDVEVTSDEVTMTNLQPGSVVNIRGQLASALPSGLLIHPAIISNESSSSIDDLTESLSNIAEEAINLESLKADLKTRSAGTSLQKEAIDRKFDALNNQLKNGTKILVRGELANSQMGFDKLFETNSGIVAQLNLGDISALLDDSGPKIIRVFLPIEDQTKRQQFHARYDRATMPFLGYLSQISGNLIQIDPAILDPVKIAQDEARAKEAAEAAANAKRKEEESRAAAAKEAAEAEAKEKKMASEARDKLAGEIANQELGDSATVRWPGIFEIPIVYCPPGDFEMFGPPSEQYLRNHFRQVHVTLSHGFWMAKTEVTQQQWEAVMGNNPSPFKGQNLPVENVTVREIALFVDKINAKQIVPPGWKIALPSEAQWEYACRAGEKGLYSGGEVGEVAWYMGNCDRSQPVGTKKPNRWGIFDMHGNVAEICDDIFGFYPTGGKDPQNNFLHGEDRDEYTYVVRGGCYNQDAEGCRSAHRTREPYGSAGIRISMIQIGSSLTTTDQPGTMPAQPGMPNQSAIVPNSPQQPAEGAVIPAGAAMTGERYPETRNRLIDADFARGLEDGQLRYAINEMFARHGAVFPVKEINDVFKGMPWYHPDKELGFDEIESLKFSDTERANLQILGAERNARKAEPQAAGSPQFTKEDGEVFVTSITKNDIHNSKGVRITDPVLVLMQDRANVHRFGNPDGDDVDQFFREPENRAKIRSYLERGSFPQDVKNSILIGKGEKFRVRIYKNNVGENCIDVGFQIGQKNSSSIEREDPLELPSKEADRNVASVDLYEIIDSESNIREGPGTNYPIIRKSRKGEVGEHQSVKMGWMKLQFSDGSMGWVHEQNVKSKN